jgi:hypothetical protein
MLSALANLHELKNPSSARWSETEGVLDAAAATLATSLRTLRHGGIQFAAFPRSTLAAAKRRTGEVITRGEHRLRRWRHRVAQIRRDRSGDLAVVSSYAASLETYLEQYAALRSALDTWIAKVDVDGVTFDEAYDFLASASASRSSIRQGIAALDAPAAVASAHNDLMSVMDQAISAVDSAYDGVLDYEFDYAFTYRNYKETPGWQAFKSQSEQVAARYSSASAALHNLVGAEKDKVERRELPPRPEL